MLQRIRIKPILLIVALIALLGVLWCYAYYQNQRLSPQEQLLVGNWSQIGPPRRIIRFRADRTWTNTVLPNGDESTGRWFVVDGILTVRPDTDSLFQFGPEKHFPIYSLTKTTLQLGDKQSGISALSRMR